MKRYKINEVAQKLGISTGAIRLYEQKGLFSVEKDPENGYRLFSEEDIYKIWSVAYHRAFDMSLNAIDELKHTHSLAEIAAAVAEQREQTLESIAAAKRKLAMLEVYGHYLLRAGRYGQKPLLTQSEPLYFYPAEDLYIRSGSFPACTFGNVFDQKGATAYSVVYADDYALLSEAEKNGVLFSVPSFPCVCVTVQINSFLNAKVALEKALERVKKAGMSVEYPYYVLYLLSSGDFDHALRYYEVIFPVKKS